ncbi:MAG: hypothetical protein WC718_02435 [Phycisphaerales bacterium]|jgi:hypothetical protein
MILYLAADLLWASKIKGVADILGLPARPVRSVEMLEARLADSPVSALLLDLDKPDEALAMLGVIAARPEGAPKIRTLAFGPHVAKDLLQQARDAGATQVFTRGAFEHNLPDILLSLAGGASGPAD